MVRTIFGVFVVSCGCLAAAIPARAHHSFPAVFDATKPVAVEGIVAEIRLTNPHSWFYLDATDATGKLVRWEFEGQTPTSLIRSGLKPGTFKVGDKVTIKGSHARDMTKNIAAAREIILADGRSFIVGPKGDEPDGAY